jgi:hypothetical protein
MKLGRLYIKFSPVAKFILVCSCPSSTNNLKRLNFSSVKAIDTSAAVNFHRTDKDNRRMPSLSNENNYRYK